MYNDVKEFGAVGDGVTKDTQAIQAALDAGGLVFFPPGTYLSGTLHLRSGGGLLLSPGATLLASPDPEDYNKDDFCPQNRVFQTEIVSGRHLIAAVEVKDIAICGGGRILALPGTACVASVGADAYDRRPKFRAEIWPAEAMP